MPEKQPWTYKEGLFALVVLAFVLFLHGAVPFFMMPTLGQAVWSMGFAQSLANGPLLDFYAHDFGIPNPAAIAFGLSGVWPASLLIRLGLHAGDAYSAVAALYLGLALFSAYRIGRRFGATRSVALLAATAWMSMPVIWAHAGYSMLSWGVALLSFYFLAAFGLFLIATETTKVHPASIALYSVATIIAIFMDGYTFMMFASGASILLLYSFVTRPEIRPALLKIALPIHAASFALAYLLFRAYIGKSGFEPHSLDFFRGWGLDLSFLTIPTKGVHWLPDLMGLSLPRSSGLYFGDGSVWTTTFALPVLLLGLLAWWRTRRHLKVATGILLVSAFGFYMALGPSIKINSTKPESLQLSHPRPQSALMPAELAIAPTGNAWISEKLPGFNVMRASYRWAALGIFGLWLLIAMRASHTGKGVRQRWVLGFCALILLNLPDPQKRLQTHLDAYEMFAQIDDELVADLRRHIEMNETVVFMPWGNDFLANYLAPSVGFQTFNIGGDKNLQAAQSGWPTEMRTLGPALNPSAPQIALKMLVDGTADVIVLPYFHMLWSPHLWRCPDETTAKLSEAGRSSFRAIPGFVCPDVRRKELQSTVSALRDSSYVDVSETGLFATVRLRQEFSGEVNRPALLSAIVGKINIAYPIALGKELENSAYLLRAGWYGLEDEHVWSQATAKLMLPVPKGCAAQTCTAVLKFAVFGASPKRPVSVAFNSAEREWSVVATSGDAIEVSIPLVGAAQWRSLSISVPEATSPQALMGSPDARILGIALHRIELQNQGAAQLVFPD